MLVSCKGASHCSEALKPARFGIDPQDLRVSALEDAIGSARIQLCDQVDGLAAIAEGDGNLDSFRGEIVLMRNGEFHRDWHLPARNKRE